MKFRLWPSWMLTGAGSAELFQETSRATEVFCDGCEWGCLKTVIVRALPNGQTRAFVACDEEPDLGRIAVAPERLKRYIATVDFAARFIARSLRIEVFGQARSRCAPSSSAMSTAPTAAAWSLSRSAKGNSYWQRGGHCIALGDFVHWDRRALTVDDRAIRRLINRKASRTIPERPSFRPEAGQADEGQARSADPARGGTAAAPEQDMDCHAYFRAHFQDGAGRRYQRRKGPPYPLRTK